jgi:Sulfotransferase family
MARIADFDRFLFIVGAPRCGTTTLSRVLNDHPSICCPVVKEPHFFAQHDLRGLPEAELRTRVEERYLRRFFHRKPAQRVGIDASVTYLYTPEQLEPILKLWPDSRFVVALRDPLSMLPSLHKRLVYTGDETIGSFADAWAAVPARAAGHRIPRRCADPRWLRYDEAARFGTYVERLFAAVGRERCHVVVFNDLVSSSAEQYVRLMEFAGLDGEPGHSPGRWRAGYDVRIRWLQRLLKRPPPNVRGYLAGEKFRQRIRNLDETDEPRVPRSVLSIRKRLIKWNRMPARDEPLSLSLQDEICRQFRSEVDRLGDTLGRDLTHWLCPHPQRD